MHMHMHMHAISMTYMHMHMHAISMHIMCMCMQMCMHVSFALAGSYQQPIEAGQSSVIGNGGWNSLKRMGNVEHRCWLQIDAGRKVHVMGWKTIFDDPTSSGSYYFNLKVSDDGNAWEETGIQLQLGSSAARCVLQNSLPMHASSDLSPTIRSQRSVGSACSCSTTKERTSSGRDTCGTIARCTLQQRPATSK